MRIVDPRLWGLRWPWGALLVFVSLTLLFVWGNSRVERGGVLDGTVILRDDDPWRRMDHYVQSKEAEGFEGREFISFILNHGGVRSVADLQKVLEVTEAAQDAFGKTIISLAEAPAYQDTGKTLLDDPHITAEKLSSTDFSFQQWKKTVAQDPGVFGLLVGRDFSWASVIRYLPPGYDEIAEFRKTVEFLEGRTIPWWEWLWKKDIEPQDEEIGAAGWTMGRGLIDQGLTVDILTLIFLGMGLTLPIFWVVLGSFRMALLCVGVTVVGGIVWTRGAMGLLGIQERVFSLLAYANVVVQGTSFALHKLAALHDVENGKRRATEGKQVDGLIATTAGIAIFGFATLWSFGLKPIQELGIASALGVVWILVLAVFFLPAFRLLYGDPSRVVSAGSRPIAHLIERGLDRLVCVCLRGATWLAGGKHRWGMLGVVCGLFVLVAGLFAQGQIKSRTRALDFIRGTSVEREARFLNQPGNVGFEFLDLLVEPVQGAALYDPHFLKRAWEFQAALKGIPGTRETASILSTVQQIAQESFQTEFPRTAEEIAAAFFLIESRLSPAVQRQLYFPGGVRISVSYGTDDSVALGHLCDQVLLRARTEFPDLKVSAFNKVPLYPRVDKYVREGKVTNVFVSQGGVALLCGLLIFVRNRRLKACGFSPLRAGLVMSLPLFFATAVIGVVMWGMDIPLDMATACIGALAMNAATDFSLYLALTYQGLLSTLSPQAALKGAIAQEGRVIVADCLLNAVCFLPLTLSHFLPVRELGWMMGIMLLACAGGALICMAALLPSCVVQKQVSLQSIPTEVQ